MHAQSDEPNCVKSQQNIAWAHVFLMSALATSIKIRAKIDEKSHVFWDVDFEGILGGFWEAKILDFRSFFDIFSM